MTIEEKKAEILNIIFWMNEIKRIDEFRKAVNEPKYESYILHANRKSFWKGMITDHFAMSESVFIRFYDFLGKEKAHLEKLITEYPDQELVEIAKAVHSGEISKEGIVIN